MPRIAIPFVGDAYADTNSLFAAQECINWVPEQTERDGTRTVSQLKTPDGLKDFAAIGNGTIRGAIVMAGVLYVVADTMLYSVAIDGTSTSLGTIEGAGLVSMSENGYQVTVVNGPKGWTYNKDTATFAQITDVDFPGADTVDFIDQYTVFNIPDTDQWGISALGDSTSYDALDFVSAESTTGTVLAVVVLHREVWVFKTDGAEVWVNTGAPDFPFERINGATINRGAASKFSVAKLDNSLVWLGNDGIVYRASGYQPVRVSTRPIEQAIAAETLSTAFSLGYEKGGHAFYVLSFPNGKTWVYDASTGRWHRRKSFELNRWRANVHVFAYNKHLIGDFENGQLWELDNDTFTEGDDPLVSERKAQFIFDLGNYRRQASLELIFNTGHGLASGQGSDPLVDMAYSDNGGRNYKNFRQASIGRTGEYGRRVTFSGMGRSRQRNYWVRVSDPVRRDLMGAEAVVA